MTTKFYLHDAATGNTGTLPTAKQSTLTSTGTSPTGSTTQRSMDGTPGTAQVAASGTTTASTTAQAMLMRMFESTPLAAQTIAAGTWLLHIGGLEANASANFQVTACVYVWRPSTGALVGMILDHPAITLEPGTTETALNVSLTGSAVTVALGDVLVCEIWRASVAQGTATARIITIDYDGTTDDSITSNAAYLSAPADIPLKPLSVNGTGGVKLKKMGLAGAGTEKTVGSGGVKLKKFGLSGAGDVEPTIVKLDEAGIAGGANDGPRVITISASVGDWLIVTGHIYNNGSGLSVSPTSITDSAGAGVNTWFLSPTDSQNPPTQEFSNGTDRMTDFVAWCHLAASVTSITLACQNQLTAPWWRIGVTRWSGIDHYADSSTVLDVVGHSTLDLPITVPDARSLVIANADILAGDEIVPSGWTPIDAEGANISGYILNHASGAYTPQWTAFSSSPWCAAIVIFSPIPVLSDTGSGGVSLKKLSLSGTGNLKISSTGSVRLKKMSLSGSGLGRTAGSGGVAIKKFHLSGTGNLKISSTGSVRLKKMSLSGAQTPRILGLGGVTLKKMSFTAVGTEGIPSSGSISLQKLSLSGSGTVKLLGSGSVTLPKMQIQGSGSAQVRASSSLFVFSPV